MSDDGMDPQSLFNFLLGAALTGLGWFAKTIHGLVQELRKDLSELHVELARDYTPVRRFEEATQTINEKLDKLLERTAGHGGK